MYFRLHIYQTQLWISVLYCPTFIIITQGRNEHELPFMMKHVRDYNDVNSKSINGPVDSLKYKQAVVPVSLEVMKHFTNIMHL